MAVTTTAARSARAEREGPGSSRPSSTGTPRSRPRAWPSTPATGSRAGAATSWWARSSSELVSRLDLDEQGRVVEGGALPGGVLGRIRDVREGPDGLVYLLTDENPGGLYRLEPVAAPG